MTKSYPDELGFRQLTLSETMEIDKVLLEEIYKLVNDFGWQLDRALFEMTFVRQDMSSLMAPRLRIPKQIQNSPQGGNQGGRRRSLADQWDSSWTLTLRGQSGQDTAIRMRWHLSTCPTRTCNYLHRCPRPKQGGGYCNGTHKVNDCPQASGGGGGGQGGRRTT